MAPVELLGKNIRFDIALLQLDGSIRLSEQVNTVCLPPSNSRINPGKNCYITGNRCRPFSSHWIHSFWRTSMINRIYLAIYLVKGWGFCQRRLWTLITFGISVPSIISTLKKSWRHFLSYFITGWGRTVGGGSAADTLQQAILPVAEHHDCNKINGRLVPVDERSMICAGGQGKGGCQVNIKITSSYRMSELVNNAICGSNKLFMLHGSNFFHFHLMAWKINNFFCLTSLYFLIYKCTDTSSLLFFDSSYIDSTSFVLCVRRLQF